MKKQKNTTNLKQIKSKSLNQKQKMENKESQVVDTSKTQQKKARTTLDYSFKDLKKLEDIKTVFPREGEQWTREAQQKHLIKTRYEGDGKDNVKGSKIETQPKETAAQQSFLPEEQMTELQNQSQPPQQQQQQQQQQQKGQQEQKKIPPPSSLVPVSNYAGLLITQQNIPLNGKTVGGKLQENKNKNQESKFKVELYCTSLVLCQNKLTSLTNFFPIMDSVMVDLQNLKWVDLSYNLLSELDYDFKEMPHLQSLYINCNQIKDLQELAKLSHLTELRSIKVYGNPIEQFVNFRLYIINALPQLKRIDSVLVSKKEKDNASMIVTVFHAKPIMKNEIEQKEKERIKQAQQKIRKQ